jgi:hypothetical protein
MGLAALVARGPRDLRRDGTALLCQDAGLVGECALPGQDGEGDSPPEP